MSKFYYTPQLLEIKHLIKPEKQYIICLSNHRGYKGIDTNNGLELYKEYYECYDCKTVIHAFREVLDDSLDIHAWLKLAKLVELRPNFTQFKITNGFTNKLTEVKSLELTLAELDKLNLGKCLVSSR